MAASAVAAGLGACTGGGSGPAPSGTFTIAYVGDLTGPGAGEGTAQRNAASMAVADANRRSAGAQFALREFDTGGDADRPAAVATDAVADEAVIGAVVGPAGTPAAAALGALGAAGMAVVSLGDGGADGPAGGGGVRHLAVPPDAVAAALGTYLSQGLEVTTAAVFRAGGSMGATEVGAALTAAGLAVALDVVVGAGGSGGEGAVGAVRALATPPDVLVFSGPAAVGGELRRLMTAGGVRSRLLGAADLLDPGFAAAAGAVSAGGTRAVCGCLLAGADDGAGLGAFARAYEELWGQPPPAGAVEAYDAVTLLVTSVLDGARRRSDLATRVGGLAAYDGLGRTYAFGGSPAPPVWVYEWSEGRIKRLGTVAELAG